MHKLIALTTEELYRKLNHLPQSRAQWKIREEYGKEAVEYLSGFDVIIEFCNISNGVFYPDGNTTLLSVKIEFLKAIPIGGKFIEQSTSMKYTLDTGPIK
jgi:hypothetical protein